MGVKRCLKSRMFSSLAELDFHVSCPEKLADREKK
jgi:hypothetical protein